MLEVTQRLGGKNYVLWGGREGYDTLLNTDLRREGAQLARFLHLVAEHKHKIGFDGPAADRAQADGADQAPVRLRLATVHGFLVRNGLEGEYRREHRGQPRDARRATASTTRSPTRPRTGCSAASTPTAATRRTAGTRTSSRTRSRTSRCRCTRSCGRGGFAPGGFNFDAKLRRQSIDRTDLFHAHIGGIDTLARALLVAADLVERGDARRAARGALRRLGRRARARPSSAARERSRRSRRRSRPARSTRAASPAARSGSRTSSTSAIWAADRAAGALTDGRRPRDRRLDDRDQGRPRSTSAARSVAIGAAEYAFSAAAPAVERAGPGALVGRRGRRRSGAVLADDRRRRGATSTAVGLTGQMHGAGPARRRRRGPPAGDPVERPADGRRVRRDPRGASGRSGSIAITGNDALTGFTAPKLVWVRDHEPDVWRARRPRPAAQGLRPAAADRRVRAWTRRTAPGTILFDLAARDWSPSHARRRWGSTRRGCRRRSRARRSPGVVTRGGRRGDRAAGRHAGRGRRRRPGGERRRGRGGGAGRVALSLGTSGVVFAATDAPLVEPRGPRPRLLPRRARAAGT